MPGQLDAPLSHATLQAGYPANRCAFDLPDVLLGFSIETHVQRSENRNRVLPQCFVAPSHAVHPSAKGHGKVLLPRVRAVDGRHRAVAVWVSEAVQPAPPPATGGWLPAALLQ